MEENSNRIGLSKVVSLVFDDFSKSNIDHIGSVVDGTVIKYDKKKGIVIVDVDLKATGVISTKEFALDGSIDNIVEGEKIKVFISNLDGKEGKYFLSKEMAVRENSWLALKNAFETGETAIGIPFAKVKGGLSVDFKGLIAFLPGSQIDDGPVKDISHLVGRPIEFKVIAVDTATKSVVVSRKSILDESYREQREKFFTEVKEGDIVEGVVRNITDYGAFIDLGFGLDALLHLIDITWDRISHPSEVLKIGDKIRAKVIKNDRETGKIALSIKHTVENSWMTLVKGFEIGQIVNCEITNIVDYGLFVQITNKVEGLIHVSEITWAKDYHKKHREFKIGEKIDSMIIDVDTDKQRITLSIKRLLKNPWKEFADSHAVNDIVESTITKIADYGIFVGLGEIDGLVYIEDVSWSSHTEDLLSSYKVGDPIKVVYLGCDEKMTKIKLGIKQLFDNPFEKHKDLFKVGNVITTTVIATKPDGVNVQVVEGVQAHIKRMNLSRDRMEQRVDRFTVGDKLDAKIVSFAEDTKKLVLSVKDLEEAEYQKMLAKYGSNDTGASIAGILGIAFDELESGNAKKNK